MTFALAYHEAARHGHKSRFWGFDSFQGLPSPKGPMDSHPKWVKSTMSTSTDEFHELCEAQGIPRTAYSIVPGFYEETLPAMSTTQDPSNISLAYIDCDLYSSTKLAIQFLLPRLKHGMIIAFDDYFCWSASNISGERLALLEFFADECGWDLIPYMQFGWHGLSFVVEDRRLNPKYR